MRRERGEANESNGGQGNHVHTILRILHRSHEPTCTGVLCVGSEASAKVGW